MSETKVKAIVLGGIDYKEKDKLISLFTLEQGIVPVVFRGVKNVNAKLKSAKELFSFGDFILHEGKVKTVISADIIDSFFDLTKNIKKYYVACAIIDVIKTVLLEGETNSELFVNTLKSFKMLCYENVNYFNIINKFLITVFERFGYKFTLNFCNNCGAEIINNRFMNINYGDITCANCRIGNYIELSKPVYSAIRMLAITNIDKISTIKIPTVLNEQVFEVLSLNFASRFNKKLIKIL